MTSVTMGHLHPRILACLSRRSPVHSCLIDFIQSVVLLVPIPL